MELQFHLVNAREWYPALEPLFRKHYAEMQARLERDGVTIGDYDPNLTDYFAAADAGRYQCAIVVEDDTLIGYCTFWVTNDMHCQTELICQEDALYVLPWARKGARQAPRSHAKFHLGSFREAGRQSPARWEEP